MNLLTKKTIRILALICITLFFIIAIIAIVLAGISYRFATPDWKPNFPFSPTAGLQIACIIYTFVIVLFGYLTFLKPNIAMTIAFSIFLLISLLFNLAVAILCIVASRHGWINTYFGCNARFDGILGIFQGIDTYLQIADQNLCSRACPCLLTNTTEYSTNTTILPYFNQWEKSVGRGAVAFNNCSTAIQAQTYNDAVRINPYFDPERNFDAQKFADYIQDMERRFECTGWCNVTYYNTNTQKNTLMFKYLFSDINRGPPQRLGCLDPLIEFLPPYLQAFGSIVIVLAFLQMIVLALAICQCLAREKDHQMQIPHHHDDARQ